MRTPLVVAALTVLALAGCSSPAPVQRQPGTLPVGTAEFTVNDADAGTSNLVSCGTQGALTTIDTGDDQSGVTALVSTADGPTAETVTIRNVGGFTGSYNAELGGDAEVTVTGRTYVIRGTADGFATDNPSFRSNGAFTVKVSC